MQKYSLYCMYSLYRKPKATKAPKAAKKELSTTIPKNFETIYHVFIYLIGLIW